MTQPDADLQLERFGQVVRELQAALDLRPWTPIEQARHRGELLARGPDDDRESICGIPANQIPSVCQKAIPTPCDTPTGGSTSSGSNPTVTAAASSHASPCT